MLRQRIITAIILVSLIVNAVIFLPTFMLACLLAIIIGIAAWEWAACVGFGAKSHKVIYVSTILLCLVACLALLDNKWIVFLVFLGFSWWLLAIFLVIRYQSHVKVNLSSKILKAMIGGIILIPAWLSLVLIHTKDSGITLILFLFLLVWLADSAAYFSGKRFGNKKLASNVSPGKSWEGVYGALFVSFLLGITYTLYTNMFFTEAVLFLVLVLIVVSFSILGDLIESMFKRMSGLKDSSRLLPGHGGVLDRIDSLTSAAPVFFSGLWALEKFL